jgi:tetratricopeptide (TPR) repeat protein
MRALATTLVLLASPALAAPLGVRAPTLVADVATPAPVAAPLPVEPSPAAPASAAPPELAPAPAASPPSPGAPTAAGAAASPASAAEPATKAPPPPVVPSQALVEKVGQGDRLFLAADYRNALFAYQDAVYMEPRYAPARVRLGRAYLALRYPAQALAQAEAALAAAPDDPEAKKLRDDARNPPVRPAAPPAEAAYGVGASAAGQAPRSAPRVFRFTPEGDGGAPTRVASVGAGVAPRAPAAAAATGSELAADAAGASPEPRVITIVRTAPADAEAQPASTAVAAAPAPAHADAVPAAEGEEIRSPAAAAQHYRAALVQLQDREWAKAAAELTRSIRADPSLAVAYAARGSALFGLGRYREASDDYRAALSLDRGLATPLYGLAECYRVLGDAKRAAEMYERYADSSASDVRPDLRTVAAKRAQELR